MRRKTARQALAPRPIQCDWTHEHGMGNVHTTIQTPSELDDPTTHRSPPGTRTVPVDNQPHQVPATGHTVRPHHPLRRPHTQQPPMVMPRPPPTQDQQRISGRQATHSSGGQPPPRAPPRPLLTTTRAATHDGTPGNPPPPARHHRTVLMLAVRLGLGNPNDTPGMGNLVPTGEAWNGW